MHAPSIYISDKFVSFKKYFWIVEHRKNPFIAWCKGQYLYDRNLSFCTQVPWYCEAKFSEISFLCFLYHFFKRTPQTRFVWVLVEFLFLQFFLTVSPSVYARSSLLYRGWGLARSLHFQGWKIRGNRIKFEGLQLLRLAMQYFSIIAFQLCNIASSAWRLQKIRFWRPIIRVATVNWLRFKDFSRTFSSTSKGLQTNRAQSFGILTQQRALQDLLLRKSRASVYDFLQTDCYIEGIISSYDKQLILTIFYRKKCKMLPMAIPGFSRTATQLNQIQGLSRAWSFL